MGDPVTWVLFAVSTSINLYQQNRAKKKAQAARDAALGQDVRPSNSAAPLPVLYGRTASNGSQVFAAVNSTFPEPAVAVDDAELLPFGSFRLTHTDSGNKNEFLMSQTVIGTGNINRVVEFWVDDQDPTLEPIQTSAYSHWQNGGTADPVATAFSAQRGANDKFTNHVFATNVFKLDREDPQYGGVPQTIYFVEGSKVSTVERSGAGTDDDPFTYALSSDTSFTPNAVNVLLDYLVNDTYGPGWDVDADIDLESFYDSQQIAAEVVQGATTVFGISTSYAYGESSETTYRQAEVNAGLYDEDDDVGTAGYNADAIAFAQVDDISEIDIIRYEYNGSLDTEADHRDNIQQVLSVMPGAEFFRSPTGKWKLVVPDSMTAEADQSAATITTDDLVSEISVNYPDSTDKLNQLDIRFPNIDKDYAADTTTYPVTGSKFHNDLLAEDNNILLRDQLELPGVSNIYQAVSMAGQRIIQGRRERYEFTLRPVGFLYEPGDVLRLVDDLAGLDVYVRVIQTQVLRNLDVKLTAVRFDKDDYNWHITDLEDVQVRTAVTNDLGVPESLTATWSATERVVDISWSANSDEDVTVNGYIVEHAVQSSNDDDDDDLTWVTLTKTVTTMAEHRPGDTAKDYRYRVRAESSDARRSAPTAGTAAVAVSAAQAAASTNLKFRRVSIAVDGDGNIIDANAVLELFVGTDDKADVVNASSLDTDNTWRVKSATASQTNSVNDFTVGTTAFDFTNETASFPLSAYQADGTLTVVVEYQANGGTKIDLTAEVSLVQASTGADGDAYKGVTLYQNATSAPTKPAVSEGFTASTGNAAATGNWTVSASDPADGEFTWSTTLELVRTNNTGNWAANLTAWGDPVKLTGDAGADGAPGANGDATSKFVPIYRTGDAPATITAPTNTEWGRAPVSGDIAVVKYPANTSSNDDTAIFEYTSSWGALADSRSFIDADIISTTNLAAINADLGNITAGSLKNSGTPPATAGAAPGSGESGTNFDVSQGRITLGDSSEYLAWNGSTLTLSGATIDSATLTNTTGITIDVWASGTAYKTGDMVVNGTDIYRRSGADFTSGDTFDASNWDLLTEDTNTTYSNFGGADGTNAGSAGLVPAPGATENVEFLRGDGTWAVPTDTDTTYSAFTGADGTNAGSTGLVPAPAATENVEFLRGDGTWAVPTDTSTVDHISNVASGRMIGRQSSGSGNSEELTPSQARSVMGLGALAQLDQITTSQINGTALATDSELSADNNSTIPTTAWVKDQGYITATLTKEQVQDDAWDVLTGTQTGITVTYQDSTNDVDFVVTAMSGASATEAGTAGTVPQPAAGENDEFLRGDGTWATPADTNTTYTAGTGLTLSGTTFNHTNAVTAATQGGAVVANSIPIVNSVTRDAQGHITSWTGSTITPDGVILTSDSSGNLAIVVDEITATQANIESAQITTANIEQLFADAATIGTIDTQFLDADRVVARSVAVGPETTHTKVEVGLTDNDTSGNLTEGDYGLRDGSADSAATVTLTSSSTWDTYSNNWLWFDPAFTLSQANLDAFAALPDTPNVYITVSNETISGTNQAEFQVVGYETGDSGTDHRFQLGVARNAQGSPWAADTDNINIIVPAFTSTAQPTIDGTTLDGSGALLKDDGDFFVGDSDSNYLFFDQSAGTFTIGGDVVALGDINGIEFISGDSGNLIIGDVGDVPAASQSNVIIGRKPTALVDADKNVFIGQVAASQTTASDDCVVIGHEAGAKMNGDRNTSVGAQSGSDTSADQLATGSDNTNLGYQAGEELTTANRTVNIGSQAGALIKTFNDTISVGYNTNATAAGAIAIGNSTNHVGAKTIGGQNANTLVGFSNAVASHNFTSTENPVPSSSVTFTAVSGRTYMVVMYGEVNCFVFGGGSVSNTITLRSGTVPSSGTDGTTLLSTANFSGTDSLITSMYHVYTSSSLSGSVTMGMYGSEQDGNIGRISDYGILVYQIA